VVVDGDARPAEFNKSHCPAFLAGSGPRYVCVYPFVRSYEWYLLPDEERRELLAEHAGCAAVPGRAGDTVALVRAGRLRVDAHVRGRRVHRSSIDA